MSDHCHSEHTAHSHSHDDHSHNGAPHDHTDDLTPALQYSLYQQIDFDAITTFNEAVPHSGRSIVKKTWAERLQPDPELESDADEQLLMHIPFTAQIKLHSLHIRSSASPSAPRTLKLFANRDDLDFSLASELAATQEFELAQTSDVQEVPVKRALFGKVQNLTLFFEDNFGDGDEEVSRLSYLGFKGEWMTLGRAPVGVLYEAVANPKDHKVGNVKVGAAAGLGGL